ncbi:MAG: hypothetical protein J2P18_00720 [Nocardia sp.]|nr:hypothetical protein [Nocardia sp.]
MTELQDRPATSADHADAAARAHRERLESASSMTEMVRYACAQLGKPTTAQVREWLAAHGQTVGKSTLYKTVRAYRDERGLADTADLPRLTAEAFTELTPEPAPRSAPRSTARSKSPVSQAARPTAPQRRIRLEPPEAVQVPVSSPLRIPAPEPDTTDHGPDVEPVRTSTAADTNGPAPARIDDRAPAHTNGPAPAHTNDPAPARVDTSTRRPPSPAPDPESASRATEHKPLSPWPVLVLALPAFVAIWSGWVRLGEMTGFGVVHPLPGIADGFRLDTAITLPIGVETYASYALYVWLSGRVRTEHTRRFAMWSAFGSLALGAGGQIAYHLMESEHITMAPWWITTGVACLPVVVLGMGAALAHMIVRDHHGER